MKFYTCAIMVKMLTMFLLLFSFILGLYGDKMMICPPLVKTFSASAYNQSYFECGKEGDIPVLKKCPAGEMYWASKEVCVARPDNILHDKNSGQHNELREYTAPVLGRPVYLGCLFDAQRNVIKPADSFWKESTIKANKKISISYASDVSFYAVQSTFDRLAHMDISASLKMDFLGGLVSVEGSAAYLKDSMESENTVAFVMKAHYLTRSETLPTATKKDYLDVCKLKDVTHVVTAITYGMDAFFVFKKTVKIHESKEKIEGSLKIAIKSIPSVKVEGGTKVIISGDLKEKIKGIDAKLRGDFVLDVQPTTYTESVLVFKTLTSHLGKKPEYADAAKMKMILTPVTRFCDQSTAILVDISQTLIHSVTKLLDMIEQTKMKAKTLQLSDAVRNYIPLAKMMSTFTNRLQIFELEIKSELQTILPKIRGGSGGSGEKDLIALLTKYKTSPFYYDTSIDFLKTRHREIEALDSILNPDTFKGTQVEVVDYEAAGDIKTLFKKKVVLLLKFNILPNVSIVEKFLQGKKVDESKSWFNNHKVVSTMGKVFRNFMKFAAANTHSEERGYLFAVYNADKVYVNVYAVKNQQKLTDNFTFPERQPKMVISSSTYNSVTFNVERPQNIWVTGFIVRLWKFGREHDAVEKDFEFKKGINTYELTELMPNEVYLFAIKYVTVMGSCPYGPESSPLVMKPCSVPSNIRTKDVSSKSFTIYWDLPLHIGRGVEISGYNVAVTKGGELVKTQITGHHRNITLDDLEAATIYNISLQAVAKTHTYNGTKGEKKVTPKSAKVWFSSVTSPDSPSQPIAVAVSYHSAKFVWTAPKIASGAVVKEYLVRYILLNNLGNKERSSDIEQSSGTNTSISINDLVQGSTYGISVKIVTSMGSSDYSSVLIVKTRFKETELDTLRRSIEEETQHTISAKAKSLNFQIKRQGRRIEEVQTNLVNSIGPIQRSAHDLTKRVNAIEQHACLEVDVDYDGYDTSMTFVLTWQDCSNYCRQHKSCDGWTWATETYDENNGKRFTCWAKNKDWKKGRRLLQGVISGSRECGETKNE